MAWRSSGGRERRGEGWWWCCGGGGGGGEGLEGRREGIWGWVKWVVWTIVVK